MKLIFNAYINAGNKAKHKFWQVFQTNKVHKKEFHWISPKEIEDSNKRTN